MPHNSVPKGIYVFVPDAALDSSPAAALAVPGDLPEDSLLDGVPGEHPALAEIAGGAEYTEIPALGGGAIGFYSLPAGATLPAGWQVREIRAILPAIFTRSLSGPLGRLLRAWHIFQWRRDSRYCGSCGHPNGDAMNGVATPGVAIHGDAAGELARKCPACGRVEYPRISPAMIVLITNEKDEALLAHNRNFRPGVYSLVAGFVEAGEDLESAVVREVREEVNIEVEDIRYIASQPWPFPNSLMVGFTARYKAGTLRPDGVEIEDARWYRREELPDLPGNGSVSRYLINKWRSGELP
jgi:NAD+ diphosphatase